MRIADRYIIRELLPPFALGVGGFLVILIGDVLYTLAELIISGRVSPEATLRILFYKLPAIMVITFPISTLFGALLGLGRLVRDRELQAMRLIGMSLPRLFAPVLVFVLVVAGLTFLTNEFVTPWANHQANTLIRRTIFGEVFPKAREQVFMRAPGNRFLYVRQVDPGDQVLKGIMIYETDKPFPRLITAQEGIWSAQSWVLRHGVIREIAEDGYTSYEARFATMEINIGLDASAAGLSQKTPDEMTVRELRAQTVRFGTALSPQAAIEYHRKFAIPAASLIFALVAAPLSLQAAHGGRFLGFGYVVVLLFSYYVFMSFGRALGTAGAITPFLAAWAPNLIFLVGGCLLVLSAEGWLALPSLSGRSPRAVGAGP